MEKKHASKCKTMMEAVLSEKYECDCDGYHTFEELYDHRITLFIALCRWMSGFTDRTVAWRSKLHNDGTSLPGWFILGISKTFGHQITYHLPNERWDDTEFAETLKKAPKWDGHTSDDVIERLKSL